MIVGAHTILYAEDPPAAREFFRDVLELDSLDAGGGWLIFRLPPGELAVHPGAAADAEPGSAAPGASAVRAELFLMCTEIESTRSRLQARGVEFLGPVTDQGWGLLTHLRVPGFGPLGLYEPRHPSPLSPFP